MDHRNQIFVILLIVFTALSCSRVKDLKIDFSREEKTHSIKEHDYLLPVIAESFDEYEWNEESKRGYNLYLTGVNEYFLILDYEKAVDTFYSAIDIYRDDARFYVRLAEALARLDDYSRAKTILDVGETRLEGFMTYPGVNNYYSELNQLIANPQNTQRAEPPKGFFGKTKAALTWLPRKIWWGAKKLWIF
ncbi:MAG: tetratricopeptide repeat protein [bacterium]|nr:tetratricopeptide repeat protein [bacterium]